MKKLLLITIFAGMAFAANARNPYKGYNYNYGYNDDSRGYAYLIQAGYGYGVTGSGPVVGDYEANRVNFSMVNGYKFSTYFTMGVGTGFNYYMTPYCEAMTVPLFLYLHSNFSQGSVSPFVSLSGGYNAFLMGLIQTMYGGFPQGLTFEPTLGLSFKVGSKTRLSLSLSYTVDQISEYEGSYTGEKRMGYSGALNFKVGILNF